MNLGFDIANIAHLLSVNESQLAESLSTSLDSFEAAKTRNDDENQYFMEKLFGFAYSRGLQLNASYEDLLKDKAKVKKEKVLFHGAKSPLSGPLNLSHTRTDNDLGRAFYLGESYEQAAMYIAPSKCPYVYAFSFKDNGLKIKHYDLSEKWMIIVAYSRGLLNNYLNKETVQSALKEIEGVDLIISPIADNRMYTLISRFSAGELTDMQTLASLAATNLGEQYAFKTKKALSHLEFLQEMYVPQNEKRELLERRDKLHSSSLDKSRLAQRENLGIGRYIDQWE